LLFDFSFHARFDLRGKKEKEKEKRKEREKEGHKKC
jgi:hypothetical protein